MARRVLIVEDDPDNAYVLGAMCERGGYQVLTAPDGERALALMMATPVDVVLLDVRLPGLDGVSVLMRMRADRRLRRIPVVFQTALATLEKQASLRALGPQGLLVKPFSRLALLEAIGQAVECQASGA
ncbi:MAG: response regulator [Candidatus Sericytochromatia bacterium]